MKKRELLSIKELMVTEKMLEIAKEDKIMVRSKYSYAAPEYHYGKHMMSCERAGILKISIFSTECLRFGSTQPTYNVYLDKSKSAYITYDFLNGRWSHASLDNLAWPKYTWGKTYTEESSSKLILDYLQAGVLQEPYEAILAYQEQIRESRLFNRHDAQMEVWRKKMERVPKLPKDWKKWTNKTGITQNFIFYEYMRSGDKQGYCTWCEKMVPIKNMKHNKEDRCSCCGHKIQYKSVGRMPTSFRTEDTAYLIQRCGEDEFAVREFYITRCFYKNNPKNAVVNCMERRRILYNKELQATEFYHGVYKKRIRGWIEGPLKKLRYIGYVEYVEYYRSRIYGRTIPSLSKSVLQRTGFAEMWRSFNYLCPVEYFGVLKSFSFLEQIVKANLTQIAKEIMDRGSIQLSNTKGFARKLGIDRFRLNRLRENKGGVDYLEWLKHEKLMDKVIPDSVIKWFEKKHILPKDIRFIMDHMSEIQVKNYLERQCRESKEPVKELITTWKDYLTMAKRIHMDISDPIVYRVKSLVQRHDEIVRIVEDKAMALKAGKIAEDFPCVDDVCKSVKEKYEYEDQEYKIIVPESIEDILNDAKGLHHCVDKEDTYFDRINQRETYLLMLRKKPEIDKQYYTLEVEPDGTIRQARTDFNRQKDDYKFAELFLRKWQKQLKRKLEKTDYELAQRSRKMRDQELKDLRRKKVKINGGDYQGRLLADVLEEGLIELQADENIAA